MLAAARPDPGRADSHGRTDLDLAQAGLPERILGSLDPGEASGLLTELCGATLPPAVRDSLLAAAAGNPLALIERTLALLSACSGRPPAIKAAAAALGVGADGLDRLHGLVRITDSAVAFTHEGLDAGQDPGEQGAHPAGGGSARLDHLGVAETLPGQARRQVGDQRDAKYLRA